MLNPAEEIVTQSAQDNLRQMHILVLDDSEVDRKRLLRLCDEAGLNSVATEAATIAEMQAALKTVKFDLIFIDYLLVDEDGLDALDAVVTDPEQTATTIMIAGEGRVDIAVEAMRRGCSDYLTKSGLSVDSLQKSVATALERRMMGLALEEEREKRRRVEQSIRRYASECSVEMRTILAGTLRRVRKLRAHTKTQEHSSALGELERSIDRLWDALPQFSDNKFSEIEQQKEIRLIEKR